MLVSNSTTEKTFELFCSPSSKSEICLNISPRSTGSRALSGAPEEISHRSSSTILPLSPRPYLLASQGVIVEDFMFGEASMPWISCVSLLSVKTKSALVKTKMTIGLALIFPFVSLHGPDPFRWQPISPTCIPSQIIYVGVGPSLFPHWPRFTTFNIYGMCLTTITRFSIGRCLRLHVYSCFDNLYVVLLSTDSFAVEEIISGNSRRTYYIKDFMLFVPVVLQQCQVRESRFFLSGFGLLLITFIPYNLKQPIIVSIQHSQNNFVHSLILLQELMKDLVFYRRDSDWCFRASKRNLSDLEGLFASNSSTKERYLLSISSVMERSICPPFCYMEETFPSSYHVCFVAFRSRNSLSILTVLLLVRFGLEDVTRFAPAKREYLSM
ncbi:hypothetical protein AALP_AA6G069600 [Arabis alpina]|uniref:Uncharacterized protein n=1 Tax=Arabis alpina TaxID=50452 RepID=A0A087GML0_ARAAL|nr:hypothetical protein AALP_AA6G069600 [Arabis alpina]